MAVTGKGKKKKTVYSKNIHTDTVFRNSKNRQSNQVTRESLSIALIYLMNEKDFDKISITELVERAGVSRTAFYRNYTGKEDLLKQIGQALITRITDLNILERGSKSEYDWFLELFRIIREHEKSFSLFLNAGLTPDKLFDRPTFVDAVYTITDRTERYRRIANEGALVSVVNTWFREGMQESPEEMAELCVSTLRRNMD